MKFCVKVYTTTKTSHIIDADSFREAEHDAVKERLTKNGVSIGVDVRIESYKINKVTEN